MSRFIAFFGVYRLKSTVGFNKTVSARSAFQGWFWLLYVLVLLGFSRIPSFPQYFPLLFCIFFAGVFENSFISPVPFVSLLSLFTRVFAISVISPVSFVSLLSLFYWGFRNFRHFPSTFRLSSVSFLLGFSQYPSFPQYISPLFCLFFTGVFAISVISPVLSASVRALFYWGNMKKARNRRFQGSVVGSLK